MTTIDNSIHKKQNFFNFQSLSPYQHKIHLSNDTIFPICKKREVKIYLVNGKILCITNILYILELCKNLFFNCKYGQQGGGLFIKNQINHLLDFHNDSFTNYFLQDNLYLFDKIINLSSYVAAHIHSNLHLKIVHMDL